MNVFTAHDVWRTPRTFSAVTSATAAVMVIPRPAGVETQGTSCPRYEVKTFSTAAPENRRDQMCSQPTRNAGPAPNASRV